MKSISYEDEASLTGRALSGDHFASRSEKHWDIHFSWINTVFCIVTEGTTWSMSVAFLILRPIAWL